MGRFGRIDGFRRRVQVFGETGARRPHRDHVIGVDDRELVERRALDLTDESRHDRLDQIRDTLLPGLAELSDEAVGKDGTTRFSPLSEIAPNLLEFRAKRRRQGSGRLRIDRQVSADMPRPRLGAMDILVVHVLSGRLGLALQIEQEGQVVREHDHLSVRGLFHETLRHPPPIIVIE